MDGNCRRWFLYILSFERGETLSLSSVFNQTSAHVMLKDLLACSLEVPSLTGLEFCKLSSMDSKSVDQQLIFKVFYLRPSIHLKLMRVSGEIPSPNPQLLVSIQNSPRNNSWHTLKQTPMTKHISYLYIKSSNYQLIFTKNYKQQVTSRPLQITDANS